MSKSIRDVIYGFIKLDDYECQVINHPVFQRLRRIKQLSLTDMVYPGAVHSRFEHSLGVMQMASDMFDGIILENFDFLKTHYHLNSIGQERYKKIVRLAALLHDVGHAPFSHAGEDLMPFTTPIEGKRYRHEDYSIAIIHRYFSDIISEDKNCKIDPYEVTVMLGDNSPAAVKMYDPFLIFLKVIISGAVDADRADYLLRDSHHLGVWYGHFDKDQLLKSLTIAHTDTDDSVIIAIDEKGRLTAESLLLARYYMFTQVYYHKVRRIYDYHLTKATGTVLKSIFPATGCFPGPNQLADYCDLDDWTIYAHINKGTAGEHGQFIKERRHFKFVTDQSEKIDALKAKFESVPEMYYCDDPPPMQWYKSDLYIKQDNIAVPLTSISPFMEAMGRTTLTSRFYIHPSRTKEATNVL